MPILHEPGEAVLVSRGHDRLLVMRCPCACGDDIIVNLDREAGPAWVLYQRRRGTSLYPSVWRDTGCGSHFVVWEDRSDNTIKGQMFGASGVKSRIRCTTAWRRTPSQDVVRWA